MLYKIIYRFDNSVHGYSMLQTEKALQMEQMLKFDLVNSEKFLLWEKQIFRNYHETRHNFEFQDRF